MKEVFISYSSQNIRDANRLIKELQLIGVSCWLAPRELLPSTEYSGQITEAIQNATIFIVLVSRESQDSPQVLNEIALATHYRKEIIAYFLDSEPLNKSFEYYLRARHWIDASTDRLTAITKITHLVRELRNTQSDKPKSKETLEAEREGTEAIFQFARAGIAMVTIIAYIIVIFLLHAYVYGSSFYSAAVIIATVIEILVIIKIMGPLFGGSGKFTKKLIQEFIEAFKGENRT